jgi:hypothetical protein
MFGISCGRTHASGPVDKATIIAAVRDYGTTKPSNQIGTANPPKVGNDAAPLRPGDEGEYRTQVAAYLVEKNFDQLEKEVRQARESKSRFAGGVWVLFGFYDGVSEPVVGDQASDSDWKYHIGLLKNWIQARPESAAARLALAETYVKYADVARGSGYANTVSETGWKLDSERTDLAARELVEASRLKEKCPFWYEVMQQVALVQGWEKSETRELFDNAIAFQPDYYHYYREYANFLLPKWYGGPGEAERFAEEASSRVGGQEGSFIYFEIATLVTCQCDSTDADMENLSWPKIKAGYAALGQLYGYSNLKLNRYAHMAVEAGDKAAAQEAFSKIGDDWDHGVWHTGQKFETAKLWAVSR